MARAVIYVISDAGTTRMADPVADLCPIDTVSTQHDQRNPTIKMSVR